MKAEMRCFENGITHQPTVQSTVQTHFFTVQFISLHKVKNMVLINSYENLKCDKIRDVTSANNKHPITGTQVVISHIIIIIIIIIDFNDYDYFQFYFFVGVTQVIF